MKAAFIDNFGPPERICFDEFPTPAIGDCDVLVKVAAVTTNPIDTYIRAALSMRRFRCRSSSAGHDRCCRSDGPPCHKLSARDRVWTNNQGYHGRQGTFAEFCCVREELLYRLPPEADLRDSVAVLHSGLTALLGPETPDRHQPGRDDLHQWWGWQRGLSGAQFAKAAGAPVIVTSANHEKAAWSRELGAATS